MHGLRRDLFYKNSASLNCSIMSYFLFTERLIVMKKIRYTEEQIAFLLKPAPRRRRCSERSVFLKSYFIAGRKIRRDGRLKERYRLRQLENENQRLVADFSLNKEMFDGDIRKKS